MVPTLTFDLHALVEITFYVLLLFFSIYAIFLGHHWFTYGASRRTSTMAMAVYLGGGAVLFITMAGAMRML